MRSIWCFVGPRRFVYVLRYASRLRKMPHFGGCAPHQGAMLPKFELGRDFCAMHLPLSCGSQIYGPIYVKFFTTQVLLQAQVQVLTHKHKSKYSNSKSKYLTLNRSIYFLPPSFIVVWKLSCWHTNPQKQTNRRRRKHSTFCATLRHLRVKSVSCWCGCCCVVISGWLLRWKAGVVLWHHVPQVSVHFGRVQETASWGQHYDGFLCRHYELVLNANATSSCLSIPWLVSVAYLRCVSKNVPTFILSVTLSNLNRFSHFLHCWKAYEICYKTHTTLPTSHVATLPLEIKNSNFWPRVNCVCVPQRF